MASTTSRFCEFTLSLFRGEAGAAIGGASAHPRRARRIAATIAKLPDC
jgi:hypothetical protein